MENQSIYKKLHEAASVANVIEASESGYVSLDDDSIKHLSDLLLEILHGIIASLEAGKKNP